MIEHFIIGIFNTSAVMGLSIAIAGILLKVSRKRYSAGCRKRIWIFMAFCLLIPFHLFHFPGVHTAEIPNVVLREFDSRAEESAGGQGTAGAQQPVQSQAGQEQSAQDRIVQNSSPQRSGQGASKRELTVADVLFAVWACGCVLLAVFYAAGYRKMWSRLRRWSSECTDVRVQEMTAEAAAECRLKKTPQVRIMKDSAEGPFTTGVLRNTIILPDETLQERDLRFILKHEATHCRNHDISWRLFLLTVNIIHWFNPLVWLLRRAAEQDMEIACDEAVVSMASREDRKEYSDVILSWVEKSRYEGSAVSTGYVSGVKFLKRRFDSIFNGGRKKNGILLAGGVCALALFIGCAMQLQSGGRVYAKKEIPIDDGFEVRTDVNGDGEAERVYVSDNVFGDDADTQVSVRFSDGETVRLVYPDYWDSYLVVGDLSGNGAADIVLIRIAVGSVHLTGEVSVLHVQTDEEGKPELVEYPDNFIQNPELEPEWTGWEEYIGEDALDREYAAAQPVDFSPESPFSCMGATVIEKDGKTMLRLIEFLDPWTESARCIDCSYTAEGWYIEDMQIIYAYGGSEWEDMLLGYTWGSKSTGSPEPVGIRTFTEEEVKVTPRIEQYDFAVAMERGSLQQIRGVLPGMGEGVWYTVLTDGVEYFYGAYDDLPDKTELYGYAIVSKEYSLANGISVGMTKGELLERYPDMVMSDMEGNILTGVMHMGWNHTAYPRSRKGMDGELDYGGADYYYWDSQFDYIMIADIECEPDTLPLSVALMMKDDAVAAITFYYPTAN